MKLTPASFRAGHRRRGWALLAVMSLAAVSLMVLAGVMKWANENATVAARNNEYFATTYAAESATEKALSAVSQQYQNYGFPGIQNLSTFGTAYLPSSSDSAYWSSYRFSGGGTANRIIVTNTAPSQSIVLNAPFTGLNMTAITYEIIANAQNTTSEFNIVSTVGQQVYLGTIPLFQFAIFYQNNLEIAPGANMTVTGPVHGNTNIYLEPNPGVTLTLQGTVSAVDQIILNEDPDDPSTRSSFGTVTFDGSPAEQTGMPPLNLPVGTNATGVGTNDSQNIYGVLLPPQAGQGPTTSTGTNLLYNQADVVIIISNNNAIGVFSGPMVTNQNGGVVTVISNSQWSSWLSTNGTFVDQRDNSLPVNPVVINVSNLVAWSSNTSASVNPLRPVLSNIRGGSGADVQSIYVDDQRSTTSNVVSTVYTLNTNYSTNTTTSTGGVTSYPANGTYVPPVTSTNTTLTTNSSSPGSGTYIGSVTHTNGHYIYYAITGYTYRAISSTVSTNASYLTNVTTISQPGVVLSNGAYLPPQGLSVATPDPAYIIGNWNVQLAKGGTSDAGTNSTAYSLPSAIYSDAITILSQAWNPANSAMAIGNRVATSDTVNAAFLTGNMPSDDANYSGGVENFPRFLENWSGQTFTYNGSMVCAFSSQIADYDWPGTGTVYNPPTRNWAFDNNFNNPAKTPPLMPKVIMVQRSKWVLLAPYTTSF
jgi:hypothetical protein